MQEASPLGCNEAKLIEHQIERGKLAVLDCPVFMEDQGFAHDIVDLALHPLERVDGRRGPHACNQIQQSTASKGASLSRPA